ncbi:conserved hypothetical Ustilaginaceae-specific protein [Sporisorium reilianum SRZ2]|uniref:Uncharacterized protein n=2 Tax=Sporisorium reilianum TaxID=72558 RepID=A0A2N8UF17_9BASI|nr:conserved hypothetical Ustilaginaceae-specific protein [Sporisorium reilianum SRZ2]SJX63401.1 uncharacterized protein SRS1_14196 [Sporisorium reilianum f. sp. reilianum]
MKHASRAMIFAMIAVVVVWESGADASARLSDARVKRAGGAEVVDKGKKVVEEVWSARPSASGSEIVLDLDGLRLDHPSRRYDQAAQSITMSTSPSVSTCFLHISCLVSVADQLCNAFGTVQDSAHASSDGEWNAATHPQELSVSPPLEFPIQGEGSRFDAWAAVSPRRVVTSPPRPRVDADDPALLQLPLRQDGAHPAQMASPAGWDGQQTAEAKRAKGKGKLIRFGKSVFKRLSLSSSSSSGSASSVRASSSSRTSSVVGRSGSDATPESNLGRGKSTRFEGG